MEISDNKIMMESSEQHEQSSNFMMAEQKDPDGSEMRKGSH